MENEVINPVKPPKQPVNIVRILAIAGLILILGMAIALGTLAKSPSSLNASIQLDGNQFRITNNDDFEWKEVNLVLNSDWKHKESIVAAHNELVVPFSQFVKDDGSTFSPSSMNPSGFYIFAQIPNNQTGSWFYKFP